MKLLLILLLLLTSPALAQVAPTDSTRKSLPARLGSSTADTLNRPMLLTVKQYNDLLDRLRKLEQQPKTVRRIDQLLNEEAEYRKTNRYEK